MKRTRGLFITVALRTEGVDRNELPVYIDIENPQVALRTEGVDRNTGAADYETAIRVALRTEGVDRNQIRQ